MSFIHDAHPHAVESQLLIARGVFFGALHVLAGPDHLSALATLSVGSSYRAFAVGIRWGLGHSSGLLVIAAIFIYLKGNLDLRRIGRWGDLVVGIFMLCIGCYSAYSAFQAYSHHLNKLSKDGNRQSDGVLPIAIIPGSPEHHRKYCGVFQNVEKIELKDPNSQKILAFIIGIVHGIAGPGAILGVLPAVEMRNWRSSFVYLISFVITSTLSMGVFAALYGEVSKRIASTAEVAELIVSLFSASLSIVVGIVWIVLSALGTLDKYFH